MNDFSTIAAPIAKIFQENVKSVHRLMEFDHILLEYCTISVSSLAERMRNAGLDNKLTQKANQTLQQLKLVRQNESLRPQYAEIFNQSLVLLVSYFGSSIRDLFKAGFGYALRSGRLGNLSRQEIKISLLDLRTGGEDLTEKLTEIFLAQKDISFQDMQSIGRAFGDHFGFKPSKDRCVNNIIIAQACRHVIVHSGSKVDAKLLKQVADAQPRDIKISLELGGKIEFQPDEIRLAGENMIAYFQNLVRGLHDLNNHE